ncbi:recombinase [Sinorhizobium meliloti]|uniref:Recombinase n=1 Tax=Rhizobium meliloti (strain 1021) TaxID=266834 RepID=B2REE2_RHIME
MKAWRQESALENLNGDWMTPVLPPAKSFGNILRLGNGRGQFLDSLDTPEAIITGRGLLDNGEPRCIAFGGLRVDDAIEEALLGVVEPGAIAAAVEADRNMASQRDQVQDALLRDLEAARYAADRALRQYAAADPENRLVTSELEARWNKALALA